VLAHFALTSTSDRIAAFGRAAVDDPGIGDTA